MSNKLTTLFVRLEERILPAITRATHGRRPSIKTHLSGLQLI
ncbi:hypothetical protein [Kocuria massiliensis]|nr:hypothetical protein [Kocuria massiliensis]